MIRNDVKGCAAAQTKAKATARSGLVQARARATRAASMDRMRKLVESEGLADGGPAGKPKTGVASMAALLERTGGDGR